METKILVGIPTNRNLQPQMVTSLVSLIQNTKHTIEVIIATQGYTISENRNYLAAQAIKGNYTHLLMIDDDMIFPHNTLDQLLDDKKDIVGVVAHSRTLP